MTQIPVVNVNNNCSTASTALYLAAQAVAEGEYVKTIETEGPWSIDDIAARLP